MDRKTMEGYTLKECLQAYEELCIKFAHEQTDTLSLIIDVLHDYIISRFGWEATP